MPTSRLARWIRSSARAKRLALAALRSWAAFGQLHPGALPGFVRLFRERRRFISLGGQAPLLDLYPCLADRTATTGFDAHYLYQAVWAARQVVSRSVRMHVDIGSDIRFASMLTASTEVTFVDIRPLQLDIPGFSCRPGSLLALPFEAASVQSLSCLHVIEHVGLGRYGDPLDPRGSEKAAGEIVRVIAPGGHALVSMPIGRARVQFNGQRVFDPGDVVRMFEGLSLVSFAMVDAAGRFIDPADPSRVDIGEQSTGSDCGLGLFVFSRPAVPAASS